MTVMKKYRPRCFFDVEIGGLPMGRVVFELFDDLCPITCENFRSLCTGERGLGKTTGKPLHYKGIVFHRVVRDFMIQSGDFSIGNGTGGESIYGGTFDDENLDLKHDKPFLLSMANRGKNTNGSQFFITTQPAPHLDGVHVVFGHVVSGKEVVSQIEVLPVDRHSRPLQDAKVSNCGELVLKVKSKDKKAKRKEEEEEEESSSSESSSDEEDKERKKKGKKKRKDRRKSNEKSDDGEEDEGSDENVHPLVSVSKIDPSEIPDVPSNRLFRGDNRQNHADDRKNVRGRERGDKNRERDFRGGGFDGRRDMSKSKVRGFTKSGRIIKGRGVFRYRTPSRSRSRSKSRTPPHWRQASKRTIKLSDFERIEAQKKAREEELARREEARKKRHEERQRQQMEHMKRLREEAEQHQQRQKPSKRRRSHSREKSREAQDSNGRRKESKSDPDILPDNPLGLTPLEMAKIYENVMIPQKEVELLRESSKERRRDKIDGESRRSGSRDKSKGPKRKHGSRSRSREHRRNKPDRRNRSRSTDRHSKKDGKIHKSKPEKLAESDDDLDKERERLRELERLKHRMEEELQAEARLKERRREKEQSNRREKRSPGRRKHRRSSSSGSERGSKDRKRKA